MRGLFWADCLSSNEEKWQTVEKGVGSKKGRSISLAVSHPEGLSSRQEDDAGIEDFDSVLALALNFGRGDA